MFIIVIIFIIFGILLKIYMNRPIKTDVVNTSIKTDVVNVSMHPDLVHASFSEIEINSFKYYEFSKIIYGKHNKSVCYLTPTNELNEIPILSWNGYYINNFCVDKNYRRKGHGIGLLKKVVNLAINEQKDHLILQVDDKNNGAKQLYYKMGFINYFKGNDKNDIIKLFLVKFL